MQNCISVIMPTYQRASLIERAIASVLGQKGIDGWKLEVIVIDDESTDNTAEVISNMEVPEPHVLRYERMQHVGKPGLVRNHGIGLASGDYIAYCDSDDIWLPFHLATCLQQFALYPDVVMVETWWSFQRLTPTASGRMETYEPRPTDGRVTTTNSRLHTRAILERTGLFSDIEWGEDLDLWTRIAFAGPVRKVKVPTTVNAYIFGGDNITFRYEPEIAREFEATHNLPYNLRPDPTVKPMPLAKEFLLGSFKDHIKERFPGAVPVLRRWVQRYDWAKPTGRPTRLTKEFLILSLKIFIKERFPGAVPVLRRWEQRYGRVKRWLR